MTQKVLRVGSSAAVTIPKQSLAELGLKVGDSVRVAVDTKQKIVTIHATPVVDRELIDWTDQFIKRYRSALDALAHQ